MVLGIIRHISSKDYVVFSDSLSRLQAIDGCKVKSAGLEDTHGSQSTNNQWYIYNFLLLLLQIQTFIIVYKVVFILAQ